MLRNVTVRAPATTANLGPGFDCLGMALDIWSQVHVETGPSNFVIHGEGISSLEAGPSNLIYRSFRMPFLETGQSVPDVSISCHNGVPLARGLGSSSAAVIAGLTAGNEFVGRAISQQRLLKMATEIEGHPDNVVPALLGGCQIVVQEGSELVTTMIDVSNKLRAVLFVPDVPMPTDKARSILPSQVSTADAIYNIGRVGLLVAALSSGDFSHLDIATQDRLHQPYRQTIFPAMKNIFRSAISAGALGVFLSGAGSSVLALTQRREVTVGYEMAEAAAKSGVGGTVRVTQPSLKGVEVVHRE